MKKWLVLSGMTLGLLSNSVAWAASGVQVSDLVLREMLPGSKVTAGYFTITNNTDKPVSLRSVSSTLSPRIEIHQHLMAQGMMQMKQFTVDLIIKPHQHLSFQPGGYHLMVFNPTTKIKKGLSFELQLDFKTLPSINAKGQVISVLEQQQNQHSHH
jgi:copper(I)-binding protein